MNLNTKVKWGIMDRCSDTSIEAVVNSFVEVFHTERNVALVVFCYNLSKKYIPIGAASTAMYFYQMVLLLIS